MKGNNFTWLMILWVLSSCPSPTSDGGGGGGGGNGGGGPPPDTTPPAEVTGLGASGANTQVTLTWTDPTDADLDKIVITWTPAGGPSQPLLINAGVQTAIITGLTNNTTYTFTVKTRDTSNNTSTGSTINGTPQVAPDSTPPTVGTNITFASTTSVSTQVSWGAATDDTTAQNQLQYKLVRASAQADIDTIAEVEAISGAALIMDWTTNVITQTASGLSPSTTYWFAVLVRDANNNKAIYTPQSQTTLADTPPTVGTNITFASTTSVSTQVSWGAATDDVTPQASLQYKLVRALNSADIDTVAEADAISGSNLIMNWTANVTSQSVSGLSVNTTYWFAVLVKDGANNKSLYTPQSVTTNDVNLVAVEVLSPTGTSVNPSGLAIVIRFNKSLNTTVKGWLEYDHVPRRYMESPPKFDPTTMDRLRISATITFSTTNVPNDTVTFTPLYGYALQTYANPKVGGFSPASGLGMSGHTTLTHSFSTTHIPLTNELSGPLNKWNDQNIYFLLTDRFNDGDTNNNQFIMSGDVDYTLGDGKFYQGGDFVGLKNKMTYLQNLGVTAIWITAPVMQAWENATWTSYHGYWAQDFLAVDPHLGTMKDFREMVQEAHNKGIKVIMDIVINHTASLFYYDLNSDNTPGTGEWEPSYNSSSFYSSAKWLDSFSWALKANRRPPYFGSGVSNLWDFFYRKGGNATSGSGDEVTKGDFAGLRDVNTENTSVRDKMKEIFKWWIGNTNIDGFRIDTVKHVEGSFWTEFCNEIRTWAKTNHNKDFFMIAEVYDGSASGLGAYTHTNRLDSVLGFHMADEVFDWNSGDNVTVFKDNGAWTARPKTITIQNAHNAIAGEANLNANSLHTNGDGLSARQKIGYFIDNHDLNRFLNGNSGTTNEAPTSGEIDNLRLALAWLYTWEGIPVLYYGTEQNYKQSLALTSGGEHGNGAGNVNKGNRPNLWQIANSSQGNTAWSETHDTFNWIKGLNQLRAQYPALRRGSVAIRWVDDGLGSSNDDGILAYLRKGTTVNEDILVVINTDPTTNRAPSAGSGNDIGLDWPVGTVLEVVPIPGFVTTTDKIYDSTNWVTTTTTFAQTGKTSAAWFQVPPKSIRILKKQGYNP